MANFEFSSHAKNMLAERNIPEEWIWKTIDEPDQNWMGNDGNTHYTKHIKERDGRALHVVTNPDVHPKRIITVFFDRRLGKRK